MNVIDFTERNVVMRIAKPYPGARSHVYVGRVVAYDGRFVAFDGSVLHYGHRTADDPTGGMIVSERAVRWVALQRIEYLREMPEGMDPYDPEKITVSADGTLLFTMVDRPDLIPD